MIISQKYCGDFVDDVRNDAVEEKVGCKELSTDTICTHWCTPMSESDGRLDIQVVGLSSRDPDVGIDQASVSFRVVLPGAGEYLLRN